MRWPPCYVKSYIESDIMRKLLRAPEIWTRLHHPSIVPVFGTMAWSVDGPVVAIVSAWMPRGNLSDYLAVRPLSISECLQIVSFLSSAEGVCQNVTLMLSNSYSCVR